MAHGSNKLVRWMCEYNQQKFLGFCLLYIYIYINNPFEDLHRPKSKILTSELVPMAKAFLARRKSSNDTLPTMYRGIVSIGNEGLTGTTGRSSSSQANSSSSSSSVNSLICGMAIPIFESVGSVVKRGQFLYVWTLSRLEM